MTSVKTARLPVRDGADPAALAPIAKFAAHTRSEASILRQKTRKSVADERAQIFPATCFWRPPCQSM
jgi:hypothetical protein